MKRTTLSLIMLLCLASGGCDVPNKIDRAIEAFERLIATLTDAKNSLVTESENWRAQVKDAMNEAENAGSDLFARDLRNVAGYAITESGIEIRCNWTFARKSVEETLKQLIAALEKKKAEMERTGEVDGTVSEMLNAIAIDPRLPPFICGSPHKEILMERQADGSLAPRANEEVISYTGFGFDESIFNVGDAKLLIRRDGVERELSSVRDALNLGKFQLGLNMKLISHQIRAGDNKLVLKIGQQIHEIPIIVRARQRGALTREIVLARNEKIRVLPVHSPRGGSVAVYGGVNPLTAKEFDEIFRFRGFGTQGTKLDGQWYYPNSFYKHKDKLRSSLATFPKTKRLWIPPGGDSHFGRKGPFVSVAVGAAVQRDRIRVESNVTAVEWKGRLPYGDFSMGSVRSNSHFKLDSTLASDWDIVDLMPSASARVTVLGSGKDETFPQYKGILSSFKITGERMDSNSGSAKQFACELQLSGVRVLLARKGQYRLNGRGRDGRVIIEPLD